MTYIILQAGSVFALECEVGRHLKDGWVPQGGVSVTAGFTTIYAQAMSKGSSE